jgi:hypothetical protein
LKALVMLCVLAGTAHANVVIVDPDPPDPPLEPPAHEQLLGWRIGGGMLPVRGIELQMMSLGLAVEHRVHGRWRIAGEYEYVWLGVRDTETRGDTVADGSGHRANVLLRATLLQSRRIGGMLQFYADAELGGGMMLASEPMTGTIAMPQAFVGVRLGYTFIKLKADTRASPVWEPEIVLRAIATKRDEPLGYFFAIGINWGD